VARVLVILPTLGQRRDLLRQALESIVAQGDIARCVVVAPTLATDARELVASFGMECVSDPARGISAAVNAGLAARDGEEFYAWLGDDDLFRPGALRTLATVLDHAPKAVLAFGACDYVLEDGRVIATNRAGRYARWVLSFGPDLIPHPGTMVRLTELMAAGGFDEDLRYTLDLDLFLTLKKQGPFARTTDTVSAFRWHPDSLTVADRAGSSREAIRVKKRHLPAALRPFHGLWNYPVAWLSSFAASQLNRRARRLGGQ